MEILTFGPSQTKKIGEVLAKDILKTSANKALVLGLVGDLGGGKTTFLQGFARGLGIKEKILSPTFVIFRKFKIQSSSFYFFYHFDCYRLKRKEEILDLGLEKIISNSQNIVAIEWADRIKKIMPEETLWIEFEFIDTKTRKINFIS